MGSNLGIFPNIIVSKILSFLPAKTICRFKLVSKAWSSIICNRRFLCDYVSGGLWAAIFERKIPINPIPDETMFTLQWKEPSGVSLLCFTPVESTEIEFPAILLTSSNGFLLFYTSSPSPIEDYSFAIVNPITCEWILIPNPPSKIKYKESVGFITQVCGETGVLKNFAIVEYRPMISYWAFLLRFSSESWTWELIRATHDYSTPWCYVTTRQFEGQLLCFNAFIGILVWDDPFGNKNMPIYEPDDEFSLRKDELYRCGVFPIVLGRILLPTQLPDAKIFFEKSRCFDVVAGFVLYVEINMQGDFQCGVWRLREVNNGEWSLQHQFSLKDLFETSIGIPCFFHPCQPELIMFRIGNSMVSFDLQSKLVESSATYSSCDQESFLVAVRLPDWPAAISARLIFLKELANWYFKAKNFKEAINLYSRSIFFSTNKLDNVTDYVEDVKSDLNMNAEGQEMMTRLLKVKTLAEKVI